MSNGNGFDDSEHRTTVEDVRQELEAEELPIPELTDTQVGTVGIVPAALVVDEDLEATGMSNDRLELLERYLAAHFVLSSGVDELRQADSESRSDGSSTSFAGDRDYADYRSTSAGQKAVALDESGTLANANKPPAVIRTPDARGPTR
ncbi:hypothetical protein [Natrialba sp. SSL1]|uniref:hypothetical protein n=1 Tax=Natrialba sp. SSL1 TaxID=1869245 RepID=UPI0008F9028A|nr:hypothetical protein [Natrialba sp. SSL1]OIB56605.1 hypothetical protein BBD46_16585 [Natrialba sp. SSL1]